ncbi:hypothetical protein A3712_23280 [Vibrio sp. HI00D65]|nr:hypothetical protein A3712_23280 [Vibrio sp. HI00D65]
MKFGDGDGATTFTLPNHHLGHFVRGAPSGVNHGDTQGDAIRNIVGDFKNVAYQDVAGRISLVTTGAFKQAENPDTASAVTPKYSEQYSDGIGFDASRVVPTANENRPYTANLSIKIHRGWM